MGERHVVPARGERGWKVIGASTGATETRTSTQSDAIEQACAELEFAGGCEVLIHGLNGVVQDKRTVHGKTGSA